MKTGFVAIVGKPNVGKSTILNDIINHKVSIVTNKSQTTRNNIRGIYNSEKSQIVFVDTPGIHKPFAKLNEQMNQMALCSLNDTDVNILVVDCKEKIDDVDHNIIEVLKKVNKPLIIVLNKIDLIKIDVALNLKEYYSKEFSNPIFIETVATEKFNIDEIIKTCENLLSEGPLYYENDVFTDQDDVFFIKETIRENILKVLKEEVPHSVAIFVENVEWEKNPLPIFASIIVEKDSQKGILIGKDGKMIKNIGTRSRKQLEAHFKKHVILKLNVKVEEGWRNSDSMLKKFGYLFKK